MDGLKEGAQYESVKAMIPSIKFDGIIKSTLKSPETAWPKILSKIQVDKIFETHGAKVSHFFGMLILLKKLSV